MGANRDQTSHQSKKAKVDKAFPPACGYEIVYKDDQNRFFSYSTGFNRRWVGTNLEAVYIVYTADGACAAFEDATNKFEPGSVRVQSGAHCYEDFVFDEKTKAVLQMSQLLDWGVDPERGYYLSSGDTNWGAFKKLFAKGKVLPGGSCYSVGLGGHISGGGDGILSRLNGVTVDWLTGVEVVVKDKDESGVTNPARLIYVSKDSTDKDEHDLWWAHTGGGGGNFGVITKYYFKDLPDVPKGAVTSNIGFDWSTLTEDTLYKVLEWYFAFAKCGDNLRSSGKFQIYHEAAGEFQMYLQTAYFNDKQRLEALEYHKEMESQLQSISGNAFKPGGCTQALPGHGFLGLPKCKPKPVNGAAPENLGGQDFTFYESTQTMNSSGANQRGKYKSAYHIHAFDRTMVHDMFTALKDVPDGLCRNDMKQSLIQVDCFGGQINKVSSTDTAIAQRNYFVKLQFQTYWTEKEDDLKHIKWISDAYELVYSRWGGIPNPFKGPPMDMSKPPNESPFEGCYYNYPDVHLNHWNTGKWGALTLYFLGNFQTNARNLVDIKKRWDPNNYFQHAQSIPDEKKPLTGIEL
eukprot:CAMPEP_0118809214 /NCGR_PEP_ID=MMETSP1162-20130426/73_1 /TAXON_ID=33656 /ORGANISM="Phaeocystis Sp, Strain CCMP2710" /LENGTH=573 /DNA_ID=CAMNT_0006738617 /DNA_START=184 /DNA_END=1905 /DNA_ORIENTATION=-